MRLGCRNRVHEIVGVWVALVAKIKPRMRILMGKQRTVSGNVLELLKLHDGPPPCLPRLAGNRMCRRTHRQQIDHHELAIMVPARAQEPALWLPSHGEGRSAIEHPWPIDALVDCGREILYFGVIEMLAGRQHAAKQKRGVDRGEFGVPCPLPGFQIKEVVEEAVLVSQVPL